MTSANPCLSLPQSSLEVLFEELLSLKQRIISSTEIEMKDVNVEHTHQTELFSIVNLLNYVVMRREVLHPLQTRLAKAGLSSLGRIEPHVMSNINCVLDILSRAILNTPYSIDNKTIPVTSLDGYHTLNERAQRLFGSSPNKRLEYIMVTMPSEAASDMDLVEKLILAGMNSARINCAHDDQQAWHSMIENIQKTAEKQGVECRILMDLAGHKIRTGDVFSCKKRRKAKKNKPKLPRVNMNEWVVLCKQVNKLDQVQELFDVPASVVVTCTYPDVINLLSENQTVWIDDGRVGMVVRETVNDAVLLQVIKVGPKGLRIKPEKGLNFPQTDMNLPTLSQKDMRDLDFVARHADMVGLSFAECAEDVLFLQQQLEVRGAKDLPILAKIETAKAVNNLPDMLVQALAQNINIGIMLARGDLAVELGSVRMAETQDEILRLCESAHTPVIWATQVLESLAKEGVVSRPEITDASMSQRAECVMLNKGPYIESAVEILSDVLERMEAYQFKNHTHLRTLKW